MRPIGLDGTIDCMSTTKRPTATRWLSRTRGSSGRAASVGWLEIAVAITLLGSLLTIPLQWVHLSLGGAFTVLAAIHVARWRRIYLAILRRSRRRASVSSLLLGSAIAMTVSGVVQWLAIPAAIAWHGATSMLLLLLAIGHAAPRLCRRKRPRRPAPATPTTESAISR